MGTAASTPNKMAVTLDKQGSTVYRKLSYPVFCGIYSLLETATHIFHFNRNHEIIRLKSKNSAWSHPHEWLKRTRGDDWVYYSTGGYSGVFDATGEYYLPNFAYSSNSILGGRPFAIDEIKTLVEGWYPQLVRLSEQVPGNDRKTSSFFTRILAQDPPALREKARRFHEITGGPISVLPPDSRHVDYDLIPLTISRGCLYKCRFCRVKNKNTFRELTRAEIAAQIASLRQLYGDDLGNYNSLFLGEHDALQVDPELLCEAITAAYDGFELGKSYLQGANVFLFGSVGSLLGAGEELFARLAQLPVHIFINVGFESADANSLRILGKPVSPQEVEDAFQRMLDINKRYLSIEISGNFILDDSLPESHLYSVERLIRDRLPRFYPKGAVYFSPLAFDQPSRHKLFGFHAIKRVSRLPTFLYIIQRL